MDILKNFKTELEDTKEWLIKELAKIRTGRASASLLDSTQVEVYGAKTPINQVASVVSEDARTLRVTPWDNNLIKPIDTSITAQDLGVSTSVDDKGVRVHFPELTTETREKIAKAAKSKHEDARVTLRGHRDEIRSDVQKKQKDGYISEDEARDQLDKVEELTLKYNKEFDDIYETKYKELTTI